MIYLSESESESDIICVDLDGDWSVKIINNYGTISYYPIKDHLVDKDSIDDVSDIFTHLILPDPYPDPYGHIIRWEIMDRYNLYKVHALPYDYYKTEYDPCHPGPGPGPGPTPPEPTESETYKYEDNNH